MSNTVQLKRRVDGAAGSPPKAGFDEGELVLNFPGAAGGTTTPELWAFDGAAWRRANPPGVSPNVVGKTAVSAAATVEAAFNADAVTVVAGDILIYNYGGSAYIYSGSVGAPVTAAVAANFTNLGSATAFASLAEIVAGTNADHAIAPDQLKAMLDAVFNLGSATTGTGAASAFVGAADVGKVLKLDAAGQVASGFIKGVSGGAATAANAGQALLLNAAGKIDAALLPALGGSVKGGFDFTTGTPTTPGKGDIFFNTVAGATDAGNVGIGGQVASIGDMVIWDGAGWHLIPTAADLTHALMKSGGVMEDGASITFDTTTAPGGVVLDGANGALDNFIIDCGTY